MTIEQAKSELMQIYGALSPNKQRAIDTLVKIEPCEDCISRKSIKQKLQEHHDFFVNAYGGFSNLPQNDKSRVDEITNCIAMVVNEPPVNPQEPKTEQFAKWVATEIFSDMWEYNKDAFAEIACRKLTELGIVRAKGDEWELVDPQESSEDTGIKLDEVIERYTSNAEFERTHENLQGYLEFRQLAEWLRELKMYRRYLLKAEVEPQESEKA